MREFNLSIGISAAIITGFRGADTVLTDDGDVIAVGSPWIAQRTPSEGDAITQVVPGGQYGVISARVLADRYTVPEPVGQPEPEPEPEPEPCEPCEPCEP